MATPEEKSSTPRNAALRQIEDHPQSPRCSDTCGWGKAKTPALQDQAAGTHRHAKRRGASLAAWRAPRHVLRTRRFADPSE